MKIRGERECRDCGARWSYYDTGSINCPDCGSVRSVGVDERREHTANPATLDLTGVKGAVDQRPVREVAADAAEVTTEYLRTRGFIRAGEIQPLDATFVAAVDLQYVARHLARTMQVAEEAELYFLSLVRGAEAGDRPPTSEVPQTLAPARGLAAAAVLDHYRRDLKRYLDEHPDEAARMVLGSLVDHKKRIEALDGDVDVETAETLVQAVVDLSHYVAHDDADALERARARIDSLGP